MLQGFDAICARRLFFLALDTLDLGTAMVNLLISFGFLAQRKGNELFHPFAFPFLDRMRKDRGLTLLLRGTDLDSIL